MIIDAFLHSVRRSRSDWYRAPSRQVEEESEILLSARCSSSLPRLALLLRLQALSVGNEAKAQESRDPLLLKVDTSYFWFSGIPCHLMASRNFGYEIKRMLKIHRLAFVDDKCLFSGLLAFSSWHSTLMFLSICPYVRAQNNCRGCTEKILWSLRTSNSYRQSYLPYDNCNCKICNFLSRFNNHVTFFHNLQIRTPT